MYFVGLTINLDPTEIQVYSISRTLTYSDTRSQYLIRTIIVINTTGSYGCFDPAYRPIVLFATESP